MKIILFSIHLFFKRS